MCAESRNDLVKELRQKVEQYRLFGNRRNSDEAPSPHHLNKSRLSIPKLSKQNSRYSQKEKPGFDLRRLSKLDIVEGSSRRSSKSNNSPAVKLPKEYYDYYKVFKVARRYPRDDSSSQFQEINDEIDQLLKTPNSYTSKLIQICDKNGLEKLEYFDEDSWCGKTRKMLLRIPR